MLGNAQFIKENLPLEAEERLHSLPPAKHNNECRIAEKDRTPVVHHAARGIDTEETKDATDKKGCSSGGSDVKHPKQGQHLKKAAGTPIMAEKIVDLFSLLAEMVIC